MRRRLFNAANRKCLVLAVTKSIDLDEFEALLTSLPGFDPSSVDTVAVGLSGGPDSLALTKLLSEWAVKCQKAVHALIVDHGLREESGEEAQFVQKTVNQWEQVNAFVLKWEGDKPEARLMEEARAARYGLMAAHCRTHNIQYVFTAHHADDQMETVLFRLAKGSGLDGLCGMKDVQVYGDITILRPLLAVEKERLIATCEAQGLEYVKDPSNEREIFARPRMRASREVLEAEGFTAKRLGVTAQRLQRAQAALDMISDNVFHKLSVERQASSSDDVVLDWAALSIEPAEIVLRVLVKGVRLLRPEDNYLPRMEKIEHLMHDLLRPDKFRKRTLGGIVFERDDKAKILRLSQEK